MAPSPAERRIRRGLSVARFMAAYMPLSIVRRLIKLGMDQMQLPADVTRESVSADGIPCEWLIPHNSPARQVLLYLHGGGFTMGLTVPHFAMAAYLAQQAGIRTLMVDYRLSPDYAFPAALHDCVTVYRWLLAQGFPAQNIVIAGDSAGGNLTITTLMKLRDDGDPLPAAAACLSPVGDLTGSAQRSSKGPDSLLHPRAIRFFNRSYVGNNNPENPLISPVFGNFHNLPPLLFHAGEDEILRDDSILMADMAKNAGVDVRLEVYPRMWHVWQLNMELPEAVQALDDIAGFLRAHLPR